MLSKNQAKEKRKKRPKQWVNFKPLLTPTKKEFEEKLRKKHKRKDKTNE